jgi:hypothetical protein
MKTLFLTAATLLSVCVAMAQTPTPYYTGFDNTAQQAGWQKFRQGTLHPYQWEFGPAIGAASPPYCAWHNYPTGSIPVPVVDWVISPVFNFTGGGKVDSLKVSVYASSGIAAPGDHFGIYLLNGSANPDVAGITLLADLTGMVSGSQAYKDTFNITIPPIGGSCYIGFKYSGQNNAFITRFDNLKIIAGTGCAAPTAINATPTESTVSISWPAVSGVPGYNYVLDNTPADPTIIGNTTSATTFSTTGLSHSTTYYFHLRSACGGNFNSGWKTQSFTTTIPGTACEQPAAINISDLSNTSVKLSWYTISGSKGYEYVVSENSSMPTNSGATTNVPYAEVGQLKPGTIYYAYLRTRCEGSAGFIFSPWIGRQFFTQFTTSINTPGRAESISIYPNPVSELLTIQGTQPGSTIAISDISGHVIYTSVAGSDITHINMQPYPTGLYFIRYSSNGTHTYSKINKY